MATLKTIGWLTLDDQKVCKEFVIPLETILCAVEYDDGKGETCLVFLPGDCGCHIDITLKQMRKILDEHQRNPRKNFDTHPEVDFSWIGRNQPAKPKEEKPKEENRGTNTPRPLDKYRKPKV
jgi:hypothetical protein